MYHVYQWSLKIVLIIGVAIASLVSLGCASGGYKLTRTYAQFVNKQNIILRIVLYILTGIVFAVTLLIDAVIFNTMDFWNGRVSANDYQFEKDGQLFIVKHSYKGVDKNLRNTEIQVFKKELFEVGTAEVTLEISELASGKIELKENGVVKKTIDSIADIQLSAEVEKKYLNGSGLHPVAAR